MKRLLYIMYQPYKFLIFTPFLIFSTLGFGSLAVILLFIGFSPRFVSDLCGARWSRLNSLMTPMFVSVQGRENIDPEQSYVIASNHQSHYDIFVLYGWLGVDFKWVMKQELRKVIALGIACEKLGHIFIDRSNKKAALESLNEAKKKITGGTSVLFFPEGTRSGSEEMGDFKKGAFRMALDLNIPVLPITILGTGMILPPKTRRLFPGRAKLIIHPPIPIEDFDTENTDELMDVTRAVIQVGIDTKEPASQETVSSYRKSRLSFHPQSDSHHQPSAHEKGPGN
ncbi:MAG: 1-acylglycerol-3-phosphate O-acyltransferase [Deltaproteobacteria bacterium]|nr:1-acylglycerol-3-phosphate O-acyltransferase [Candidatus Zymogenaceae bacterium]